MTAQVRADLLWCVANGRPVFLNLTTQRYFMLPAEQAAAFLKWVEHHDLPDDDLPSLSKILVAYEEAEDDWRSNLNPDRRVQVQDLCQDTPAPSQPYSWLIPWAIACHAIARVLLKTIGFSAMIRRLYSTKLIRAGASHPVLKQTKVLATFSFTTRVLKSNDRCLQTSIAMTYFLSSLGYFPDFIIGVKTSPWAAHAWVQEDGVVLSDEPDRVRAFTPILAI